MKHLIYVLLLSQCWAHPSQSPWACTGNWHHSTTKPLPSHQVRSLSCASSMQTEQQRKAVPSRGDLPHPNCKSSACLDLKHISKIYVLLQARQDSRPSDDLQLRGNLGATESPLSASYSPPTLLFDLRLSLQFFHDCSKCSVSQHHKTILLKRFTNCDLTWQSRKTTAH